MKFKKCIILVGFLFIACMTSEVETVLATQMSEDIHEVGVTTVDVEMNYTDEYGSYIPTDDFTVKIPKTFSINPKEDLTYDVTVQGTIDDDRDVWVCTNDTITLSLVDESLADTYGITKTQTLRSTIDKIQYSSEEIAEAGGYTQQGVIHKTSIDYEIEAKYTGTMSFYINVINEKDIIPEIIQQNGHSRSNKEVYLSIVKEHLSEEAYTACEDRIASAIDAYFNNNYNKTSNYLIVKVENGVERASSGHSYNYWDISFYGTKQIETSTITRSSTVANGKYYYTYKVDTRSNNHDAFQIHLRQLISDTVQCTPTGDWQFESGGSVSISFSRITTTDNLSVDLYLSPRCKLIYE